MILLGRVISWLLVIVGSNKFFGGLILAYHVDDQEQRNFLALRYFNESTSGAAIDSGLPILIAGVVIGLIARIAKRRNT